MKTYRDAARSRVEHDGDLETYSDLLLGDWPEGEEHFEWVATAPVEALIDWAQTIRIQEREDDNE